MTAASNVPPRIRPTVKWALWLPLALVGIVAGAVLYCFDPVQYGFFPPCVFHQLTGLSCPGCGSTRALHQLSHGHLSAAFRLNPLFVLALPVLAYAVAREFVWQTSGRRWPFPAWRSAWTWALAAAVAIFTVVRNLPW